jgi:hypothetical protein
LVQLSEVAIGVGSCGIEIAQRRVADLVRGLDVSQHSLDHELGVPIGG